MHAAVHQLILAAHLQRLLHHPLHTARLGAAALLPGCPGVVRGPAHPATLGSAGELQVGVLKAPSRCSQGRGCPPLLWAPKLGSRQGRLANLPQLSAPCGLHRGLSSARQGAAAAGSSQQPASARSVGPPAVAGDTHSSALVHQVEAAPELLQVRHAGSSQPCAWC